MTTAVESPILATHAWPTNAELIADVARLGHLRADRGTLDPTYGLGIFWQKWRPVHLTACDVDPDKSPLGHSVDFRHLPWVDRYFGQVVFDPPYKLNGTPTDEVDGRYGVHVPSSWQDRMLTIVAGVRECCRVSA